MQFAPDIPLVEKYRPANVTDLVLPDKHGLAAALQFCAQPYPSAWLFHGKPGIGKSSLADIMAKLAAKSPMSIQRFVGPDLSSENVRALVSSFTYRPLGGGHHVVIVHESDAIPRLAQIRLLDLLERLKEFHLVMCFTSNEDLENFEGRFLSRVKPQLFSNQGIANPAKDWLLRIARLEGIPLTKPQAVRIIKLSCNNLRGALQRLEIHGAECNTRPDAIAPSLPVITASQLPTAGEPVANSRQATRA